MAIRGVMAVMVEQAFENAACLALSEIYDVERQRLCMLLKNGDIKGDYANPVFGQGPYNPWLMLVGEAPGAQEAREGKPFVGKAGENLNDFLSKSGISRDSVYITNAVKYRPVAASRREGAHKNRTPGGPEIRLGLPVLKREIEILKPVCVATLGNTPLLAMALLLGQMPKVVGNAHGQAFPVRMGEISFTLFPLYHPASVIYNRALQGTCEEDIQKLGEMYRQTATSNCTEGKAG